MSRRKFITKEPPAKLPPIGSDGYPTKRSLKIIEQWNCIDDNHAKVHALLDYIQELWSYPDRFCWYKTKFTEHYANGATTYRKLYLSTGGWSGNESILEALHRNMMFWMIYWNKSQRGGHYWFTIPEIIKNKVDEEVKPIEVQGSCMENKKEMV